LVIALAIPREALRVIPNRRELILAALVTEDFALRFSSSLRMLLLVVIAVFGLVTLASAGITDPDPGVVPEPTSVLIWLGLMGVVSAVTGRRGRRE
jgi:hypothetical protein